MSDSESDTGDTGGMEQIMRILKRVFVSVCVSGLLLVNLVTASWSQPAEGACRQQADSLAEALKQTNEWRSAAFVLDKQAAKKTLGELSAEIQKLPQLQDFLRCLTNSNQT